MRILRAVFSLGCSVLVAGVTSVPALAQTMTRVSLESGGFQMNGASAAPAMTPDGRYVVFNSFAPSLASSGIPALLRHDRNTGVTLYIAPGTAPSISDDGQSIAFESSHSALVPNDTNGASDIFVWSASEGSYQRASVLNGSQIGGSAPRISGNGRYVAFVNQSSGTTGQTWVFDRVFQTTTNGGFDGRIAHIGGDGRHLGYSSVHPEGTGDANGRIDVFRKDRQTNTVVLVSTTAAGLQGDGDSQLFGMSADGRFFLFTSWSTNFPGTRTASPVVYDLFLKDLQTGSLTQVNVNGSGQRFDVATSLSNDAPTLSANGRYVVFASGAANVIAGDTNGLYDTFVYDRDLAAIQRISVPHGGGQAAGGRSSSGAASDNGQYVAFVSAAHNLVPGDTNFEPDVFMRDAFATPPCSLTLAPSGLAVVSNSGASGALTVSAPAGCTWTATPNATWLRLTGAVSGSGNGSVAYAIDAYSLASPIRSGAIVVNGAAYGVRQIGTSTQGVLGVWETPNVPPGTAVSGAIPFTGWAVDDVQVARVRIFRSPVAGEGSALIYIGDAVKVANARPDVVQAHSSYPYNTEAGWGLMVLTNMLPNQGTGVFSFTACFDDIEGHSSCTAPRTLVVDNATATAPFGTIDTPAQGETVSGTIVNFGWALTPQPGQIPADGSTIDVYIDGVNVGHPTYNHSRSDIATLFPGYANSNGAVGAFTIDTRSYADGVHTISWVVTDNLGRASGIGSRFFTVQNGPVPLTPPFMRWGLAPMAR